MKILNRKSSGISKQLSSGLRRGNAVGIGVLVLVVVLAMIATSSVRTVDTGYIGVKTRFGKVVSDSLPSGLYFVIPGV